MAHSYLLGGLLGGQVGMPGPQPGIGKAEVADWWLARTCVEEECVAAAAAPAKTMERARTRIASFIIGNPFMD
jgi:hypothetical protein